MQYNVHLVSGAVQYEQCVCVHRVSGAVQFEQCVGRSGCSVACARCIIMCTGYRVCGGCSVWCVQCIRRVQCIRCVQSMVCAVYGGAVGVVCGVCSGHDGCSVTGVQ